MAATLGGALVLIAVVWNVAALRYNVYTHYHGYGDGTTSELLRIAQTLPHDWRIVYVQTNDTLMSSVDQVFAQYGMGDRITYLRPYNATVTERLAALVPPFVVSYDLRRPAERQAIEEQLTQRFPGVPWRDSDAGRPWNLRYFSVLGDY